MALLMLRSSYPAEPFAGSARGHCGRPVLTMATTWMTAPSVITPRNASKLRKPKQQLSGTATARNKSRFMAECVCRWVAPQLILARLSYGTTPSKKFRNSDHVECTAESQRDEGTKSER